MGSIRALIFDLDGVIADTSPYHFAAWKRIADEEGIQFTREKYETMKGYTRRASLKAFASGHNITAQTGKEWMARKGRYYLELLESLSPEDTLPGVRQKIAEARQAAMKIGVASASRNAVPVLEKLQLIDTFDSIADRNTIARGKPEPDVFLWVAGALGVKPSEALVIEDSDTGAEAAKTGGFHVIGVGAQPIPHTLFTLPRLDTLSLTEIVNRL